MFHGLLILLTAVFGSTGAWEGQEGITYPRPHRDNRAYEGDPYPERVVDPYRWLEDMSSSDTREFLNQQNELSHNYIHNCPVLSQLNETIRERWNRATYSCPFKKNGKYYYTYNSGLLNQPVFMEQETLGSEGKVIQDPNQWSAKGTTSVMSRKISEDGQYLAYTTSTGSDFTTIKVMRLSDQQDLGDEIPRVKASYITWAHDSEGFFYSKFANTAENSEGGDSSKDSNHSIYYHKLGFPASQDKLVYDRPDLDYGYVVSMSVDNGKNVLVLVVPPSQKVNTYLVKTDDLKNGGNKGNMITLIDNFEAQTYPIGNLGTVHYFMTDKDAPLSKVIKVDASSDSPTWETVVPEDEAKTLQEAGLYNGKVVLKYLVDVKNELYMFDLETGVKRAIYTVPGAVYCMSGQEDDPEMFFSAETYLKPNTVFRYDFNEATTTEVFNSPTANFDPEDYTTEQVFYDSTDGTRVPMFITHKKGLEKNGQHPVRLYGYGGFGISINIEYDPAVTVFLKNLGGIYAVANIRGGGEYGENWHIAGMREKKQNVFDDFQAAAEYLIREKYTNSDKLSIKGGSNGGLLVAACMNQRPDLFAAGITDGGLMDMLRYDQFSVSDGWKDEYGDPSDSEDFYYLEDYSPLHNVPAPPRGGRYPATLLMGGEQDNRVPPLHSMKMIATLQHKLGTSPANTKGPLLITIDPDTGHGAGKPTSKKIESAVQEYSFLYRAMDLTWTN